MCKIVKHTNIRLDGYLEHFVTDINVLIICLINIGLIIDYSFLWPSAQISWVLSLTFH